jgi:HSP20 family protein
VQIQVRDGQVQISGQRRKLDVPCEQFHRVERGHGTFSRTFKLPLPVDVEHVTADLRDGVLTIVCPKTTDNAPRRIHVS